MRSRDDYSPWSRAGRHVIDHLTGERPIGSVAKLAEIVDRKPVPMVAQRIEIERGRKKSAAESPSRAPRTPVRA